MNTWLKTVYGALVVIFFISCGPSGWDDLTDESLSIEVDSTGLSSSQFAVVRDMIQRDTVFTNRFKTKKVIWLRFLYQNTDIDSTKERKGRASIFHAQFYDYDAYQAYSLTGSWSESLRDIRVSELDYQPPASSEEIEMAQRVLADSLYKSKNVVLEKVSFYEAMPSATVTESGRRAIVIGLHGKDKDLPPAIYSITIFPTAIVDISHLYPLAPDQDPCEIPPSSSCLDTGTTGTVNVTIRQGTKTLWTFEVVRPKASSGHPDKGSGVELRYVYYRGKQVLYRAHVPILNVHYDRNACGPYRDWQNQETCFDCTAGTDIGSTGFRICSSEPKTFADDQNDAGNFKGVGIFVRGQEVVFVSELAAGWYRYTSEWTFHANGTIKPRFKFGGTQNYCTCQLHFHHVYWRLDFDIAGAANDRVRERTKTLWWQDNYFQTENKSFRNRNIKWVVEDGEDECYQIVPQSHDGNGYGDPWAKGDVWVVRYHYDELHDGVSCIGCPGTTATIQDNVFLTGENVMRKDVVIWYRASYNHDAHSHEEEHSEIVGPDLIPLGKFGN